MDTLGYYGILCCTVGALHGTAGYCWLLLGTGGYWLVLRGTAGYCWLLLGTGGYWLVLGCTEVHWGLLGVL